MRNYCRELAPKTLCLFGHVGKRGRDGAVRGYRACDTIDQSLASRSSSLSGCSIPLGIRVVDKRLDEARWRFLHALWLDPFNSEALNGLGTIAWFGHDLDTAEFFVRAALRRLPGYPAARHDLDSILQLKRGGRSGDGP